MSQETAQNLEALKASGIHARGVASDHVGPNDDYEHALGWPEILRVLFVAAAAAAIWFLGGVPNPFITTIGVICTIVGGFPIFHEAYENIVQRRLTMELSMTIAIVAALAIREIFTSLVITLFVLVAEILEGLTVGRGREAIRHLIELLPANAVVRRNGNWQEARTQQIQKDDVVLVKPGARIPVDGTVIGGHSFVDQPTITGESMAVEKRKGTTVYAGTINQSGALEVRVDQIGRDTAFGKIIEAVERAEKSRAPIQGIADRLAGCECRAHRQRPFRARGNPIYRPAMPPYHHAKFCRNSRRGSRRRGPGSLWLSQSSPRRLHSRFFGNGFHPHSARLLSPVSSANQSYAEFFHNHLLQQTRQLL